jgi:hypothetical protein
VWLRAVGFFRRDSAAAFSWDFEVGFWRDAEAGSRAVGFFRRDSAAAFWWDFEVGFWRDAEAGSRAVGFFLRDPEAGLPEAVALRVVFAWLVIVHLS